MARTHPARPGHHHRRSPRRGAVTRAGDALAGWLLAYDPDANSPYRHVRAVHWIRTVIRFGLFYAAAFAVFYAITWWALPAAGYR